MIFGCLEGGESFFDVFSDYDELLIGKFELVVGNLFWIFWEIFGKDY